MILVYQYMGIFFNFKTHQIIFIHYKSRIAAARLVVDEDDNGEFMLERVEALDFKNFQGSMSMDPSKGCLPQLCCV